VALVAVLSSPNLMIELDTSLVSQLWVNREYRRGLSMHPCGAPVLRISGVIVAYLHSLGCAVCQLLWMSGKVEVI
jgi:hypothetical protein